MSRRNVLFIVLGVFLVTAVWYFFFISPKNGQISDFEDQLVAAQDEESRLRAQVAQLKEIQASDLEYLAAIGRMESSIPVNPELAVFIEDITALAESTGVNLQLLSPTEPVLDPDLGIYEISLGMSAEAQYFELLGFLFGLEEMERLVVVESVTITPIGADTDGEVVVDEGVTTTTLIEQSDDTLTVSLALNLYTRTPLLPIDLATATTTTTLPPEGGDA